MCDEDEDIDGSKLTVDSDLSTRMGAGHYMITCEDMRDGC